MLAPLIIFTGYFVAYLKSWWELSSAYRLIFVIVVYSYFEKGCRKNVHATIPKGNMRYDQFTVPDTVAVAPTFVTFL